MMINHSRGELGACGGKANKDNGKRFQRLPNILFISRLFNLLSTFISGNKWGTVGALCAPFTGH